MRLACPNCGAQYEVDDQVIPDDGRDVQCSNCGHAWFQLPAPGDDRQEPSAPEPGTEPENAEPESYSERESGHAPEPEIIEAEIVEDDNEKIEDPDQMGDAGVGASGGLGAADAPERAAAGFTAPEAGPARRRALDENLREILRVEAEREAEVRARERQGVPLETQDELGLEDIAATEPVPEPGPGPGPDPAPSSRDRAAAATRERRASLDDPDTGEQDDDTTASGSPESRRDLLPDIEEINSSLESVGSRMDHDDFAAPGRRGSGFSRGFVLMLLLAAIAVALYLNAPALGDRVPALTPALDLWVEWVNAARAWLDRAVSGALARMQETR